MKRPPTPTPSNPLRPLPPTHVVVLVAPPGPRWRQCAEWQDGGQGLHFIPSCGRGPPCSPTAGPGSQWGPRQRAGGARAARPAHRAALTTRPPGPALGPRKKTAGGAGSGESAFCAIFTFPMNIDVLPRAGRGWGAEGDGFADATVDVQPRRRGVQVQAVPHPRGAAPRAGRPQASAPWTAVPALSGGICRAWNGPVAKQTPVLSGGSFPANEGTAPGCAAVDPQDRTGPRARPTQTLSGRGAGAVRSPAAWRPGPGSPPPTKPERRHSIRQ